MGFLLRALAVLFAATAITYGAAWTYYARLQSASAELGFVSSFSETDRAASITNIPHPGPAAAAGVRAGDRVFAVNGQPLSTAAEFNAWERRRADSTVELVVFGAGESSPRLLTVRLPETSPPTSSRG